jgi:hypothetical protein
VEAADLRSASAGVLYIALWPSCPNFSGIACDQVSTRNGNLISSPRFPDAALSTLGTYNYGGVAILTVAQEAVPEPWSIALIGSGLAALFGIKRRHRSADCGTKI